MITLTLLLSSSDHRAQDPRVDSLRSGRIFSFSSFPIHIGSDKADVLLPGLEPEHIKIIQEQGAVFVVNSADDPFVTLNDLPFGRKLLNNHDVIQVGRFLLKVEITAEALAQPLPIIEEKQPEVALEVFSREEEPKLEQVLPLQLDNPQEIEETVVAEKKETKVKAKPFSPVIEADEEGELISDKKGGQETLFLSKIWQLFPTVGSVLLIFLMVGVAIAYLKINDKAAREQIMAAEGVADVSMALAYAQVNHITPQKQNWFDPDFLKNNLSSVLSSEYASFANIDNLGQFQNCPYILRIYTSIDLKQFLVIAQPEPNLFHWLFPRPAIAIDSKTMEMRKIFNIKALNRLLANPNVLDQPQAAEVSYLVRQGELIPLSSFLNNQGFAAPKALALVRPGAENLIYNAPRYYHFSEALLTKSLSLLQIMGSSYEVTRLQQQMADLSQFPNLVLYSSQGMQKALQAQKALGMLVPNHPFMVAYLNLSAEGYILNSHLLPSEEQADSLMAPSQSAALGTSGLSGRSWIATAKEIADVFPRKVVASEHQSSSEVDPHHPLFLRLTALTNERQRALKPVSDRMIALIQCHDEGKTEAFSDNFSKLLSWYLQVDQQRQEKIMVELKEIYQEYSAMPLSLFADYVKSAGLGLIARESLDRFSGELGNKALTPEQVAVEMQKIQMAKSLAELNRVVAETVDLLSLSRVPDPEKLIKYQNEMRVRTLQQLSKFMLSASSRLPPSEFHEGNRSILSSILKNAWVIDPDEKAFYMHEFDLLVEENQKPT